MQMTSDAVKAGTICFDVTICVQPCKWLGLMQLCQQCGSQCLKSAHLCFGSLMACKNTGPPFELDIHSSMHMIHHTFNPVYYAAQILQVVQSLRLCWGG